MFYGSYEGSKQILIKYQNCYSLIDDDKFKKKKERKTFVMRPQHRTLDQSGDRYSEVMYLRTNETT